MFTLARRAVTSLVASFGLPTMVRREKGRGAVFRPENGAYKSLTQVRVDE